MKKVKIIIDKLYMICDDKSMINKEKRVKVTFEFPRCIIQDTIKNMEVWELVGSDLLNMMIVSTSMGNEGYKIHSKHEATTEDGIIVTLDFELIENQRLLG